MYIMHGAIIVEMEMPSLFTRNYNVIETCMHAVYHKNRAAIIILILL